MNQSTKPGFITVLGNRCPRCGQGRVFLAANPYNLRRMGDMNPRCPQCNLNFNPEIGFYWGASYVSYVLTVALTGVNFVISTLLFGFMQSLNWRFVVVNAIILVVIAPLSFRFSRLLWLWLFHGDR